MLTIEEIYGRKLTNTAFYPKQGLNGSSLKYQYPIWLNIPHIDTIYHIHPYIPCICTKINLRKIMSNKFRPGSLVGRALIWQTQVRVLICTFFTLLKYLLFTSIIILKHWIKNARSIFYFCFKIIFLQRHVALYN